MVTERIWNLLARKLAGEASSAELAELERALSADPELEKTLQAMGQFWGITAEANTSEEDWKDHLKRMNQSGADLHGTEDPAFSISLKKRNPFYRFRLVAAAAVIILALVSGWIFTRPDTQASTLPEIPVVQNEISTKPGSRSKVQLPDGSTVWFNAGSILNYKKDYGKKIREIEFSGEGYFDIVKMPDKPFIIHTKAIDIKVLGTAFNLRAYPDAKQTETSLIRGKIEVRIRNSPNKKPYILEPNDKLIVDNPVVSPMHPEKMVMEPPLVQFDTLKYNREDGTLDETKWIDDYLVIKEMTFMEMITELERWYNVDIEVKKKSLEKRIITVTFKDETIDNVLEALQYYARFKYVKTGNKIIIY